MKKILFMTLAAVGVIAVVTGCSTGGAQVLNENFNQIQSQNTVSVTSSEQTTSSEQITPPASSTVPEQNYNNTTSQVTTDFDIASLTKEVDAIEQKVNSTQRSANYQQNWNIYNQIKFEIKQTEHKLDMMEEQVKMASRTGALDYTRYSQLKMAIEQQENRLDWLEDSLEYRLGIDD